MLKQDKSRKSSFSSGMVTLPDMTELVTTVLFRRYFAKFGFTAACLVTVCFMIGCQAYNEDVNNKRLWLPSIQSPGYLDPEHEKWTPEGSDPYPDNTIGPKSLQARPWGYDLPRDRNVQINELYDVKTTTKK